MTYLLTAKTSLIWISFGEWRGYWFTALGVHTIAGYLQKHHKHDLEQEVWYFCESEVQHFLNYVQRRIPDYICCSVNIGYLEKALGIATKIRDRVDSTHKKVRFILGNREFLDVKHVKKALVTFPTSFIVKGEGEDATLRIINNEPVKTIPNLYYMRHNKVFYTFDKELNPTEYVSPTFKMNVINKTSLKLNEQVALVEVSRGCSKKGACTFCSNSAMDTSAYRWRMLNPSQVIKHISQVAENMPIAINFVSEDFLGNREQKVVALVSKLEQMRNNHTINPNTNFYCAVRTTDIYSRRDSTQENTAKRSLLLRLKHAGFTTLYVGFESGSDSQLKRFNKGVTREENMIAIRILRESGIYIDGGFITFDPLMSLEDFAHNVSFLEQTAVPKLLLFPFNHLVIFPGTAYSAMYDRKQHSADPRAKYLMEVAECVDKSIPYDFLRLFLQQLRLSYFAKAHQATKMYENKIREYSQLTIPFMKGLIILLHENTSYRSLLQYVDEFLKKHDEFCNHFYLWFKEQAPDLFEIGSVPHVVGLNGIDCTSSDNPDKCR